MTTDERAILDSVNADNYALLYRCRWSNSDAELVVPKLAALLVSESAQNTQEALRALFRIGTSAVSAAARVASLTQSRDPITKQLAVLALGQIAHQSPDICVEPLASTLSDPKCCRDALRALAFIGPQAIGALNRVKPLVYDRDAKVRKAAVMAAAAIGISDPDTAELLRYATVDGNKIVRETASRLLRSVITG